jgi:hypothetical protein
MRNQNLETVVMGKLVSDAVYKEASAALDAGKYAVDLTLHIRGEVKRGEDYDSKIVAKADPWGLLAMALSKLNGVTVDSLTREALGLDEDALTKIKEEAKEAIQRVKGPTMTRCNGKINANLTVEVDAIGAVSAA